MQHANVRPRYEVHPIEGNVKVKKVRRNTETGMNEEYVDTEPYGYHVYFPNGHSMRVKDDAELQRLDLANPAALVDMESGEVVATADNLSLRQQSDRRSRGSKRRADTTHADANQEDA